MGRGLGNKFLDDLRHADALCHIVDASGTTDAEGKATRQAELAKLAASHELVFAPHFPFPGVGTIVTKGSTGYAFVPRGAQKID